MGEAPHEVYTDVELKARAEPRCGNCKWWEDEFTMTGSLLPWGECLNEAANKNTSVIQADSDELITSSRFGCIHFEPK